MKKIYLNNGKFTIVDDNLFNYLSQWKWSVSGNYVLRRKQKNKVIKTIFMHRLLMNNPEGLVVDHKNGNKLDNRIENLRICTQQQNNFNKKTPNHNTSGFKGVYWEKNKQCWKAYISINTDGKKKKFTKNCSSLIEAAQKYDELASLYFGEYAKTNF